MIGKCRFDSHSLRHLCDFVRQPTIFDYFVRDSALLGVDACAGRNHAEIAHTIVAQALNAIVRSVRPDTLGCRRHLERVAAALSVVSHAVPLRSCEGRLWRILLKKSFGGGARNFLEPLMRFERDDVRDLVESQKNGHGLSYRCYGASRRWSCLKISICEFFGVVRFSTFSTISTQSGRSLSSMHERWRCPTPPLQ